MASTLQFDLVSPERKLASLPVTEVQIPGANGDLTAMAGHEPVITSLRPGLLRAMSPTEGVQAYAVTGGFAEITANGVTVLAEQATPVAELTGTILDQLIDEARALAEAALPEDKALAEKNLSDIQALKVAAGH
jgi:F-type H+-transporting ATPase subunit epsilon